MQTGQGPSVELKPEQLLALKAGGHSVQELTDFCKKISQKDKPRRSSSEDTSDSGPNEEEEGCGPFIHHPFKLRDNQPNIVMNIANAKQLPILTPAMKASLGTELRVQFPVSSGSQHRAKEWVTVEKPTPTPATATPPVAPPPKEDSVFPDPPSQPVSIGDVVSERLSALRRLQSNPNDVQALTKIHHVDRQMESWATSKMLPGQFTGSTDIHMLSQQELHGGYHAWIRKDQFARAAPVSGGIGMSLLQKMGWKQGEGLGKNNKGSLEPLALSVKMDRKGLSSQGENIKKPLPVPTRKDLSGKHPISALVELCNKKKWGPPDFIVVNESGPDHKKHFIIKVKVKGMEYQPTVSSGSKKLAKAQAATVCLQQLGLIPQ
ncbi:hypothetical protein NP493_152g04028 [Ridgeia piscesae]|uniref:Protein SON n=1 Tax=Ridgeia piscesae TaxID=27915 RepID=A0AAD9UFY2_RIDPI|nr:hypothetical protein NP493_152g04028 [Ridgeia piscesae]